MKTFDIVRHTRYGEGFIVTTRYAGSEVFVDFRSGFSKWLPRDTLTLVERKSTSTRDTSQPEAAPATEISGLLPIEEPPRTERPNEPLDGTALGTEARRTTPVAEGDTHPTLRPPATLVSASEGCERHADEPQAETPRNLAPQFEARQRIEAFRLGIVPHHAIQSFTFGREAEINSARQWLGEGNHSTLFVLGDYGTGKTHLLEYLAWQGLQDGFAVAKVELDVHEQPFFRPKRIYRRLAETLAFKDTNGKLISGLRGFLEAVAAQAPSTLEQHIHFSYLLNGPTRWSSQLTSAEPMWEWIEARESAGRPLEVWGTPSLPDVSTAANLYCYLLSGLGWLAQEVLGLRGLVLVFDEAEIVDTGFYTATQRENGFNFLRALIRTAADEDKLLQAPRYTDLVYSATGRNKTIPFLFRVPSGLKLLFAFTALEAYPLRQLADLTTTARMTLHPLQDYGCKQAFDQIWADYAEAYWGSRKLDDAILEKLRNLFWESNERSLGNTRNLVKRTVEELDMLRLRPDLIQVTDDDAE